MCGIAGILSPHRRHIITDMTALLEHRGPDDVGYYHDDVISLGYRRLSIVDIDGGRQPMTNESGSLQLICNGEIYNSPELRRDLKAKGHQFRTLCDVEVILHLYEEYGSDCVKYLRGMFAFAIWDRTDGKLFLGRDHLGQKQLYYYHNDREFIFASEIKALIKSGLVATAIDYEGLWHFISLRFVPYRLTLFDGVEKLPAATTLSWKNGRISTEKYWSLSFSRKLRRKESEIVDGLDDLLQKTVKSHLQSDVRVGAFLSGGIDSGTIATMMANLDENPLAAFSIGVKDSSFNELPYSRIVAQLYGMETHEEVIEEDIVSLLPSMIYHMEEPVDPYGIGVYLASRLASKSVKVVLGGDGGDENFAGYDRFSGQKILNYYTILPAWLRRSVMHKIVGFIPETFSYKSFAQKAMWMNELSFYSGGERYAQSMSYLRFTEDAKKELFMISASKEIRHLDSLDNLLDFFDSTDSDSFVDKMLNTELMTRVPEHLMVVSDRMSMAHSLESRSPLLDYKLVEYAASIPASLKLNGIQLKYILRKVSTRYLPDELVNRPKQGFGFPFGIWMRGELQPFVRNLFRSSRFVEMGIFDGNYMTRILDEHVDGKIDHTYRLLILINLEIWHWLFLEGQTISSAKERIAQLSRR